MNDTTPRAEALVLSLLKKKSPHERLAMMGDMFAAAQSFMHSALTEQGLIEGTLPWKLAILDRMYGTEISARLRQRIIERWSAE